MEPPVQTALPMEQPRVRPKPRVALVHDYLVQDGGAERVLAALQEMYPEAPTFTLLYDPGHAQARGKRVIPSFLQRWPGSPRAYQWYMPFMPLAAEHLDLTGYDLVLSTSSSFAKGVIAAPDAVHVCYCHTPTRFLWQERFGYLNELPQPKILRMLLPPLLHRLRTWDRLAAERPDHLLTNSLTSQTRIRRFYRREATVIHPPVDVERIPLSDDPGSYWLAGGRLVGYKRFDLIVRAFAKLDIPLKIFGTGPELRRLRAMAGRRTELLGYVTDAEKIGLYRHAIGFIHPQLEDFGITAVEAMAAGKPVITYGKGGGSETVIADVTGTFLEAQCWEDIGDAVIRFDPSAYDPKAVRARAETFSKQRFQTEMRAFIDRATA